jgi:hypothetical protein
MPIGPSLFDYYNILIIDIRFSLVIHITVRIPEANSTLEPHSKIVEQLISMVMK